MIDYTKIQLISSARTNGKKKQGSGTFNVAALPGAGETFTTATIAHGHTSDNVLFQVGVKSTTVGALIDPTILPWASGDNRVIIYADVDSTNLYITCISSDSGGGGAPARTITYSYRVLIP